MKIAIVGPSAVVPQVELSLGMERLRAEGFEPRAAAQVRKRSMFFAGTDQERADAFYAAALSPETPVLWAARGGYGAFRVLPLLEKLAAEKGQPPRGKLLVGYSDSTALMEFVRTRWGWATLHGPMPSFREFSLFNDAQMKPVAGLVRGERPRLPWEGRPLTAYTALPAAEITGEVVGGNLSVWTSMIGTPYAGSARGKILFLEDVTESLYRIDRMVGQLRASGGFDGVKAVLLGTFHLCEDSVPRVLKTKPKAGKAGLRVLREPKPAELKPLRPIVATQKAIREIFGGLGIPVLGGLPVGHGPKGHAPLPLGGRYRISARGTLELVDWDWNLGQP